MFVSVSSIIVSSLNSNVDRGVGLHHRLIPFFIFSLQLLISVSLVDDFFRWSMTSSGAKAFLLPKDGQIGHTFTSADGRSTGMYNYIQIKSQSLLRLTHKNWVYHATVL